MGPWAPDWAPPFLECLWFVWPVRYPLTRTKLAVAILRVRPWGTPQNDGGKQAYPYHYKNVHSEKSGDSCEAAKLEHGFCQPSCNSVFFPTWCQHAMDTLGWGKAHKNIIIQTLLYHSQKYWDTWPWMVHSMTHSPTHHCMPPCACMMTLVECSSLPAMNSVCMALIFMYHMYNIKHLASMCCLEVGCLHGVAQVGILWRGASCIMQGECMGGVNEGTPSKHNWSSHPHDFVHI